LLFFSFLFTTCLVFVFLTQPPLLSPLPQSAIDGTQPGDTSNVEELRRILTGTAIKVKDIKEYSNNTFIVETDEGAKIIFGANRNLYSQISSLQLIVSRLTMEGKRFTHLDLRYDKPVVTFK
jgi:hypothetical protein